MGTTETDYIKQLILTASPLDIKVDGAIAEAVLQFGKEAIDILNPIF